MATLRKVRAAGKHRRRRARRVRVGRPDGQLTPASGLEAVRELDRVLGVTRALEAGIGAVKERRRGLGGGELVMAMASCQLTGGDFLVSLDRRRADLAGQRLEPVPTPASTTAAGIAKRFTDTQLRGIEAAIGTVNTTMVSLVPALRRSTLLKVATIDGDGTDVEVFGRDKEQVEYNHTGQRNLRAHIAFWAEAGVPLAAELMPGAADPRSNSVEILDRAIAALPPGVGQIKARWDAGYFARELAQACVERGIEFAIGAKRTEPVFAAARVVPGHHWIPAIGMDDTEIAVVQYLPRKWPTRNVVCIARRTRIPVDHIPTARARKRRTIDKNQLTLALDGQVDHVYGYSFILTNLDVSNDEKLAEVEWWYRHRTDIEALNKDAKHGGSLRHLPSKYHKVNAVWMWGALLACAISAWLQELARTDYGNGRGRRTIARLRRELINVPARITRSAGTTYLRLPPGTQLLATVLPRLQELPRPG
ncbi:IS1380 family transposase [Pengzhenrongella sp.]|uniref:IS1380 family transposase n=1 Tax=Pengzhenrongella sp. TaxID=2888820 RepID=UPI002F926411